MSSTNRPIAWKGNKKLRPEVILERIASVRTVSPDGKTSFSGFDVHEALPALESMLEFPASGHEMPRSRLIWRAVAGVKGELSRDSFLDAINELFRIQHATSESNFSVLTSVSIDPSGLGRLRTIEAAELELLARPFPRKYLERAALIENAQLPVKTPPWQYCNVILRVKAKTSFGAVTKALKAIDIQRGVWCLIGNSRMQLLGREWIPINVVRLGPVHTVHDSSGKSASQEIWFEPGFEETQVFRPSNPAEFRKGTRHVLRRVFASSYSEKLIDALIRYVRALDEQDQNNAFIKLWGALESLACPDGANYDLLIRRCAFLYRERDYASQLLEHLREYRNKSVHAGDQREEAKIHCFQLQEFFYRLFVFHLSWSRRFSSLDEANQFLDLPPNRAVLGQRIARLRQALKFIG